jgi:protocatechuate 3,4-dioxygenase beta subunit
VVDIWHCDAAGIYSDARDPGGSTVVWAKLATLAAGARLVSREFF